MKASLTVQDRGREEGWCPHCQHSLEQLCHWTSVPTHSRAKGQPELPGPGRLSKPRHSGRDCSDIPTRAGRQQLCRALGAPSCTFSVYFLMLPDICLSLGLQETEASMHCGCSWSHNSGCLCTARHHQWLGGSRGDAPGAQQLHLLCVTRCHPQPGDSVRAPPDIAPGKSVPAGKGQVLVDSSLAIVQFAAPFNEIWKDSGAFPQGQFLHTELFPMFPAGTSLRDELSWQQGMPMKHMKPILPPKLWLVPRAGVL